MKRAPAKFFFWKSQPRLVKGVGERKTLERGGGSVIPRERKKKKRIRQTRRSRRNDEISHTDASDDDDDNVRNDHCTDTTDRPPAYVPRLTDTLRAYNSGCGRGGGSAWQVAARIDPHRFHGEAVVAATAAAEEAVAATAAANGPRLCDGRRRILKVRRPGPA